VFIVFDPHMREGPDGEAARARNSDIVEDLGMVEYVFSDKTGTLTSNEMQLRMLAINGQEYGRGDCRHGAHPKNCRSLLTECIRSHVKRLALCWPLFLTYVCFR
jgi:P-type E1-E2 ATPase